MARPDVLVPVKCYVSAVIRVPVERLWGKYARFDELHSAHHIVHVSMEGGAHPKQACCAQLLSAGEPGTQAWASQIGATRLITVEGLEGQVREFLVALDDRMPFPSFTWGTGCGAAGRAASVARRGNPARPVQASTQTPPVSRAWCPCPAMVRGRGYAGAPLAERAQPRRLHQHHQPEAGHGGLAARLPHRAHQRLPGRARARCQAPGRDGGALQAGGAPLPVRGRLSLGAPLLSVSTCGQEFAGFSSQMTGTAADKA